MKLVIFWAANAWNTMKLPYLRKAQYPFLNITREEDPIQNVDSGDRNSSLEKFFMKIPRCDDVNAQDVEKQLISSDPELHMNDDEIV